MCPLYCKLRLVLAQKIARRQIYRQILEKKMSGRGGGRHFTKPVVDTDVLYSCLEKGQYDHISLSQGVSVASSAFLEAAWL